MDTSGGGRTVLAEVTGDPPVTSMSLTGLSPETSYAVAVRTRNDNTGVVSPLTSSAPFTTPEQQPPPPAGDCSVSYEFISQWNPGFHAELVVTNHAGADIDGWALEWTFADGQQTPRSGTADLSRLGRSSPSRPRRGTRPAPAAAAR